MDRQKYSQCVGDALRGKRFDKETRKREFCIASKLCSSKASSRDQANEMCEISAHQPKAVKASATRRVSRAPAKGGMRLVLLTSSDCKPCSAAKSYLKDKIDKGLIQELNIQKSDEGADLAAKYGFTSIPKLLVLDDEGVPFTEIQITETEQTI